MPEQELINTLLILLLVKKEKSIGTWEYTQQNRRARLTKPSRVSIREFSAVECQETEINILPKLEFDSDSRDLLIFLKLLMTIVLKGIRSPSENYKLKKLTSQRRGINKKRYAYPFQSLEEASLELSHSTSAGARIQPVRLLKRIETT